MMDSKDFITRVIAAEELKNSEKLEAMKFSDFSYFCYGGARTEALNIIDTSNGTNFNSMFYNCSNLTIVPKLNTSKGTDFSGMFFSCRSLTSIPDLDTSNGTIFDSMFYNCSNLTAIPKLNTSNGTNFKNMFQNCSSLTNLVLYNIRKSITIGSGTSYGHLLTVDSLVHTIQELCTASSSQTLTMGSANLNKIANIYCKVIDGSNEKKTMELCESTDEGAMTLTAYAALKNWNLA